VLACAERSELEAAWSGAAELLPPTHWRRPESGLVMVRGRAGATGARFNPGEMTVSRCSVRFGDGPIGHGYVVGRDRRKAELVASFDALLQDASRRDELLRTVVEPLAAARAACDAAEAARSAATRVEFFTLVRGDQ
jgi:alpha-D-ribose 1-methylphosphonate 5-triphosphate synthase subunit PhnG